MSPNYPNPFNAETRIEYAVPEAAKVEIIIYNTRGQEVVTLVDEVQQPGFKKVVWYGTDNFGNSVSSGVYFLRLRAGGPYSVPMATDPGIPLACPPKRVGPTRNP